MRSWRDLFALPRSTVRLTLMFSLPFSVIFIPLVATLMLWEVRSHDKDLVLELKETARAYLEQILITRLWNTKHGGVYVRVTDESPPNPYLKDDPERDITAVDGTKFTKINPAYMTRQISELAHRNGKYNFHITSLRPINPDNKPDAWEADQLRLFEEGKKHEAFEVREAKGGREFRYMAPMVIEAGCLQCHGNQGYMIGGIRGGISISIPMEVPLQTRTAMTRRGLLAYGLIGIASLFSVIFLTWVFSKRIIQGIEKEVEHERLKVAVQLAGAAAHELRQPMTIIISGADLLKEMAAKNETLKQELYIIIEQCYRMDNIIKKMLSVTEYKTKAYSEDVEIFDFEI